MKQLAIGVGALAAAITASMALGTGAANAFPNVQGGLYSDVKQTLTNAGYSVVVAGKIGDRTDEDKCVVANAQPGSFLDGSGNSKGKIAMVYLNCYADVASNKGPGYSAGSVEGQAALSAKAAAEAKQAAQQAAQQEQAELEAVDTPQS